MKREKKIPILLLSPLFISEFQCSAQFSFLKSFVPEDVMPENIPESDLTELVSNINFKCQWVLILDDMYQRASLIVTEYNF